MIVNSIHSATINGQPLGSPCLCQPKAAFSLSRPRQARLATSPGRPRGAAGSD